MDERASRILLGLSVLVLLWIAVYWLWQPASAEPRITWDQPATPAVQTRTTEQPPRSLTEARPRTVDQQRARAPEPAPQRPLAKPEPQVVQAAPTGTPKPDLAAAIVPPRFRDYTVRSGDTLERIAEREFGKKSLWTAIAEANPLRDPRRLKPGDVIRLPIDPDNVQGKPVAGDGPSDPAPAKPAGPVEYVVRPGDTLTGIARSYYGSQGFDEFIFFNNRDVLDSPDELKVGMTLKLPPIPGEGG